MVCLFGWGAANAMADAPTRGLITPTADEPAMVEAGGSASITLRSATALTPPPGIQEPRAHRAFTISLCAMGVPLAGPARRCFSLPVENFRPLSSHSLDYRLDVRVPDWVAPGWYELGVRYPGGTETIANGLRVGPRAGPICEPKIEHLWRPERGARVTCEQDGLVRVHLMDGQGMSVLDGTGQIPFETYPMAKEDGDFAVGVVALVPVRAQRPVQLLRAHPEGVSVAQATVAVTRGDPAGGLADAATLEVLRAPPGARVFWQLSAWQSVQGTRAVARFGGTSRAGIASAAVIGPDAAVRILRVDLTKVGAPSLGVGGCQVGDALGGMGALGLLSLAVSRKIAPRRRSRGVHPRSAVGAGGSARERDTE